MLRYAACTTRDIFICRACWGIQTQLKLHTENPEYGWFAHEKDIDWFKSDEFLLKRKNTMNVLI